ncbi:hypothetical protein E3N88_10549 [Mikania micrantha]|uniref:Uncharacterized protein n=1 Tax=Mikania micrantha TaxID=192012 RepID=A0A5N6PBX1_9ASTR|nr:hypothetical protein E3N88_10549 [Mikania micrantha]
MTHQVLQEVALNDKDDVWFWPNNEGVEFDVKTVRKEIEEASTNSNMGRVFHWNNWATMKANVFAWRACKGHIASLVSNDCKAALGGPYYPSARQKSKKKRRSLNHGCKPRTEWRLIRYQISRKAIDCRRIQRLIFKENLLMFLVFFEDTSSSLSAAGVGNSNSAFLSQSSTRAISIKSHTPARELNVASHGGSDSKVVAAPAMEENLALFTALKKSYNAFMAGDLNQTSMVSAELDQIHPEDVEEMDVTWQMAMAVFRAKNFIRKIGKNKWADKNKRIGFNKDELKCFNCHKKGHFA